jgi:TolA-binding protein/predicted negative regulator of RcsB-dependent stress response
MPLLLMAADKNELSAIDKKATALETLLNKSLDTSPEGARVMTELVNLYYNEGRVFGLVRVAERFVKSQSRHDQHRQIMLKLIDGLEVMGRRDELITIGRQYLTRYPDSTEALDVALRVSDGLERNRKRAEAADVLRLLWEHNPSVGNRKAAERASELYGQEGNARLRIHSAQICESMMEKLPASPYTVRAGLRAITEYRAISRWAESNQAAQRLIKKRLPINRIQQFELHHLMTQSYASQSQWANAVESMRKARSFKDDPALYAAQISYMHNAGLKAQQIESESRGMTGKFPNVRRRWEVLLYVGHAYARENNPTLAARSIQPALANAASSGNMAYYYVLWMVDEANANWSKAVSGLSEAQKNLENAKIDEKSKRDAFNKAPNPDAKNAAQTTLMTAVKLVQQRQSELQKAQADTKTKETAFKKQVTDTERTLTGAIASAIKFGKFPDVLALRYALSRTLYRERVKDEAKALVHAREASKETHLYSTSQQTLINDLLTGQPDGGQFRNDVAMLLKERRDYLTVTYYRDYVSNWVSSMKGNKDHRAKAKFVSDQLAAQNRESLVQALLKYPRPQDNPAKAVPLRAEALKQFNSLSPLNQLHLAGTQRYALVTYAKKKDPGTARAIARTLWQKHPQNHDAAHGILSLYMSGSDEDKSEAKKIVQQALRMPPAKGRVNYSFQRDLMQVTERLQDGNLANQIYQWAIKGDLSSIYADYTGDVLWKLNQKAQALDWWKRIAQMPTQGRPEERTCAERFLVNGGSPPAAWREYVENRWAELALRVSAHKATDTLRLQGDVAAFSRAITQLQRASADLPFVNEDWRGFAGTWRDFTLNNQTYTEGDNPAYKDFKKLDDSGKLSVYQAIQDLRSHDNSPWAACDRLLGGGADKESPMSRLQRLFRATKYTHNDQSRWNTFRSYAQKAFEQGRYMESATLLTGVLAHVTSVSKESKSEGRSAVLRAHSRMGAVGLTIDEDSPMAPLLQAALYLRLGDQDKALELYQDNAELFKKHRIDLPPDLIEFVCNYLMTGGDEERLAAVEDILRGWLIKFTDPEKPESKQQSEDAKARLQLLLAKSYFKGQRFDVARVEYSTVTNRYNGTPHAIEAKFGIGESFMAQKIYDQAAQAFKVLEENPDQQISIRAEFLTGLLAFRQDQRDEAREKFQHILERVPDVELANRTLFSLSEIYGLEQRYLQQLNLLRTVGRLGQSSKRLHIPGNALSIVVHDRDLGVSRGQNSIPVIVTTKPGGDREKVLLRSSSGAGKGLFRGEIDTGLGSVAAEDGVLQITGKDVILSDYPDDFKQQFRTVPLSDVEIRVAADGEFDVASSEIVDKEEETLTKQLEREQKEEAEEDRRVSQGRPANEVKPGNRIFMRIRDKDRDFGDQEDLLTVTLRADSGDQVQVELKETGPHTGEFRAAIPTAELPAGASASDSAIDHNPLMAIDHSRESYWQSEPDGQTPKALTVDMKQLHEISRIRINTPNAGDHAPVRGRLLGSHDGVFWFTLATQPRIQDAQAVLEKPGVMKQMIYKGDHTSYTTWAQVAQLARTTQATTNEVLELSWNPEEGDENAAKPVASIWTGKLVQLREGAMRIGVKGDLVAVAVDGKVQLAPSNENKQVDVWLGAGVHDLTIFAAAKKGSGGISAARARANSSSAQPQLKPFNKADFDIEAAGKFFGNEPADNDSKTARMGLDLARVELQKESEEFSVGEVNKIKRVHHWQKPGDWLKWAFKAEKPGAYEVWINSSHNEGGSRFNVEFGDQVIEATAQKTGDWNRFAWQRVGLVQIDAVGSQILTIKPVEILGGGLMGLAGLELRSASGAGVIQRDREWEFFFEPIELRYARFQVDEYLGDSVAVNHFEAANNNSIFIPTEVDVSTLAENTILEIAGGDVVLASYTDETSVATKGGSRLLTQNLQATYNDARVVAIGFEFERNAGGGVAQTRKELLRVDAGDRITFEVVDYDMDQTDQRDVVPVSIWLNGQKWKELDATETEEYSGTFRVEVETSDGEGDGKLQIKPGDSIYCRYTDFQNTFPGHSVVREGVVFANEPTDGLVRIIGTRRTQPPPDSEGLPQPIYLPRLEAHEGPVGVDYFVPLTVEIIDPDAAKDSQSKVKVIINAGTTNAVEVACALSTQFGEFSGTDEGQANPALRMGRFVGQVKLQLGGEESPIKLPRALGAGNGLLGRARPVGEEKGAMEGDDLLDTVLNVNGKSIIRASYQDKVRPGGDELGLSDQAVLKTNGSLSVTNEGYDEKVELLHVGEKLFVMVSDPDLDISDGRDFSKIIIQSGSGEKESVKLNETLSHSGIFTGSFELKAREKPTPANFSEIDKEIECFFGDNLITAYSDEVAGNEEGSADHSIELPVAIGTDGIVSAFSKIFGNQQLAVQTQFHIAESYFELFKNNLKLERKDESQKALQAGRRILKEIMVDYPDPRYLPRIAYLSGQFSQELEDWNAAANSYALIVRQYPNHTLAADAQYKLAQCYEEANDFDRALEEYVTLAATYPKSPLIPNVMIRINEYFYKRENYAVAAKVAEKFMDRFSDHEFAPKMCFRWGQCHYKAEKFADAGAVFDLFTKKFPDDGLTAQSLFWAGESFRGANNVSFAFRRYNRCRWDFPESEAAKYARGRLALPEMLAQFESEANSIDSDN